MRTVDKAQIPPSSGLKTLPHPKGIGGLLWRGVARYGAYRAEFFSWLCEKLSALRRGEGKARAVLTRYGAYTAVFFLDQGRCQYIVSWKGVWKSL